MLAGAGLMMGQRRTTLALDYTNTRLMSKHMLVC